MTLQELIDELAAATDGAAQDTSFTPTRHKNFPEMTDVRVLYKKRGPKSIAFSQIAVWVEDIGTPQEAAFYIEGRIPAVVISDPEPNATPDEIKANLDTIFAGRKYSDPQIQTGTESGVVIATFYDTQAAEAVQQAYRVIKDDKGVFTAYLIKG